MARFLTVPDELLEAADAAVDYFKQHGYRIVVEKREPGFPFVPAFVGKRRPSTVIVEVASDFSDERMQQWCRFGRSCSADTQVCLVLPTRSRALTNLEEIRAARVGLYVVNQNNTISEILPPHDLAMIMELPPLAQARPAIRRLLGPAYEQIDRGHWREAFETACVALEFELRKYLWHALSVTRLTIVNRAGLARTFSKQQIMKATLGRVAVLLNSATPHNQVDALLDTNVPLINRQRIDVAHYKFRREAALRRHVGRHMWSIFQCLDEML